MAGFIISPTLCGLKLFSIGSNYKLTILAYPSIRLSRLKTRSIFFVCFSYFSRLNLLIMVFDHGE